MHGTVWIRKSYTMHGMNIKKILKKFVIGGANWVWGYDVGTKSHSSQLDSETSHRPIKAWQILSNVKVMLCFFFLWGDNSSWISTLWPDGEQGILSEGDGKADRGIEKKKGLICGMGKTGCSIMTTLRLIPPYWFVIFPSKMRRCSCHSVHTRQTLHQQTSFSSPSWNPCRREGDLSLSRKLKKIRWYSYVVFQKRNSKNVSKMEETLGAMYWSEGEHFEGDRAQQDARFLKIN